MLVLLIKEVGQFVLNHLVIGVGVEVEVIMPW
jgi:hypothetical protein